LPAPASSCGQEAAEEFPAPPTGAQIAARSAPIAKQRRHTPLGRLDKRQTQEETRKKQECCQLVGRAGGSRGRQLEQLDHFGGRNTFATGGELHDEQLARATLVGASVAQRSQQLAAAAKERPQLRSGRS